MGNEKNTNTNLLFGYYSRYDSKQHAFYRIPKELLENPYFDELSTDAKLLYGILMDRVELSIKNNWVDKENRVYIIFTIEELSQMLRWSKSKIHHLLDELDSEKKGIGLITRKRRGLGLPNYIYVRKFYFDDPEVSNSDFLNSYSDNQEVLKTDFMEFEFRTQEMPNSDASNTDINNTKLNKNKSSENIKKAYGKYQNVFLYTVEFNRLKAQYSEDLNTYIEELSQWQASTGKSYSNYEAVINYWASKSKDKKKLTKRRWEMNEIKEDKKYDFHDLEEVTL